MSTRSSILRWALPPGISLIIHTAFVVVLIVVGSRAAAIAREKPKTTRLPLAELQYTPPLTPPSHPVADTLPTNQPVINKSATSPPPSTLDQRAKAITIPTSVTTQAMSAASLDQLATQSSALSSEPTSAPAPISFAGVSTGAARSIVYVIDASGATMTSFSYISERLLQSIDRLSPTQRFQVIAFRQLANSTHTTPNLQTTKNKLPRATRANKQLVANWLKAMPAQGKSNPVQGLAIALNLKPDMILLISRGIERTQTPWAGGLKQVRERLEQLNPLDQITGTRPVVIKTIQLLDEDPTGIMRAIGIFHGDGHNDHQVITYSQLISPDPKPTTPPPSSTDTRLSSIEDQLASLKASGVFYRATTSIPSPQDRNTINTALIHINAMLAKSDPNDPRTALLTAESHLLKNTPSQPSTIQSLIDTLSDSVFVSPDLDARRRIVIAQLLPRLKNQNQSQSSNPSPATTELLTLLSERSQLNLSPLTTAHAVLVLSAQSDSTLHPDPQPNLLNQPPFTTDPAWAILLAQSQTLNRLKAHASNPISPLQNLRTKFSKDSPNHLPQIDAAITQMVDHAQSNQAITLDPSSLPDLVRFIHARTHLSTGSTNDRLTATQTLLKLGDSPNPELASESLWLACLGGRALNTNDSGKVLITAASKLAQRFPDHPGAADALAGAIDTARSSNSPALIPLLRQATTLLTGRIEIDLWRLELINLTAGQEQLALIESLTPATRESDLGAQIYNTTAQQSIPTNPAGQLAHAKDAANTLDRLRSPLAAHWHRAAAELELQSNPNSAATRLANLLSSTPSIQNPELEILYAQSLLNANEPDQALSRLTTLTALLDANRLYDNHFWHAWSLIIQTVIDQGNTTDKQAARAHLSRLKLLDQNLGPEPYRSQLIKAQNTLHSEP